MLIVVRIGGDWEKSYCFSEYVHMPFHAIRQPNELAIEFTFTFSGRGGGMHKLVFQNHERAARPGPNYICHRCKKPGHWIDQCPTNGDPQFDKVKVRRPTGIPQSMLKSVSAPLTGTALQLITGQFVTLQPNEEEFARQTAGLRKSREAQEQRQAQQDEDDEIQQQIQAEQGTGSAPEALVSAERESADKNVVAAATDFQIEESMPKASRDGSEELLMAGGPTNGETEEKALPETPLEPHEQEALKTTGQEKGDEPPVESEEGGQRVEKAARSLDQSKPEGETLQASAPNVSVPQEPTLTEAVGTVEPKAEGNSIANENLERRESLTMEDLLGGDVEEEIFSPKPSNLESPATERQPPPLGITGETYAKMDSMKELKPIERIPSGPLPTLGETFTNYSLCV